jgi:DNA repair protein RecN (Recombination protein N)
VLVEMRLRGLGVIRDAALEFGPGLTVVTGETGAGKTMVVTGLGLLFGGRADAGSVRAGEASAVVEGRLAVPPDGPVALRVSEAGGELDEGDVLILGRTVSAEGRSRAFAGGRGVPVGVLSELASELITVHGQSDQQRLVSGTRQRESLDRFAGDDVAIPLSTYRQTWQRWRQAAAELQVLVDQARDRAQEAELLRLGLTEVERVSPQPGEDVALKAESMRLTYAEDLRLAASLAHAALAGGDDAGDAADVTALIAAARRSLEAVRDHDQTLGALADRLGELVYLVNDLAAETASYVASIEADPARQQAVEERRAALSGLTRAYGENTDAVLAWAREAGRRLLELDGDDDRIGELQREVGELAERLAEEGERVRRGRVGAATRLEAAVTAELQELSMPQSALVVEVRPRPEWGKDGGDDVEFLLVPHPGAVARPLGKGASGGELSRVMLGLEVVLGAVDPVPTFVFDEVDAGVGGRAALGIGRRLAKLACSSQVIVVTHLAQVAAFADRHLVVSKSAEGDVTESGVIRLDDAERVRELARMLGGVEDSGTAQAHAEELLALGRAVPADVGGSGP